MNVTWIGQAGLLFDNGCVKILIDPYLTDCVGENSPKHKRRIPVNGSLFEIEPDVILFTHDHLDHYDPETAAVFLGVNRKPMTVLSPSSVWQKARKLGGPHNYVQFDRYTEWTEYGFRFRAVKAAHSDPFAIGVVMEELDTDKVYYVTGDTLYSSEILKELPERIDVIFLPINGAGNNMNAADAVRFSRDCGAVKAVPYHVGMMDDLTPKIFEAENRLILELYKESEI